MNWIRNMLLAGLLIGVGSEAASECLRGDLTQGLDEESAAMVASMSDDWFRDAYICDLGRYKIAVPSGGREHTMFIWTESAPIFLVQDGVGVQIFGKGPKAYSSDPSVNIQDRNGDGIYDQLSYLIFGKDGKPLAEITDMDMDGTPDIKVDRDE